METEAKTKRRYLLSPEIMSHKVLLQFLIGVVDTKLLQVIDVETLKPVNIKNSWGSQGGEEKRGLCELM